MNLEWRRLCTSVSAKDEILRRQEENGLSEEAKIEVLDCLLNAPVSVGELEAKAREVVTSSGEVKPFFYKNMHFYAGSITRMQLGSQTFSCSVYIIMT